jgi:hypothetical protein
MKIEDILTAIPSKDDLAHVVGLQTRASAGTDLVTAFGIFGAGLMLGAGLALLFAPKAGSELRHDLASKGHDLADKVGETVGELRERLAEAVPAARGGNGS